jgi:uncharacterized lipoprotein YbaY
MSRMSATAVQVQGNGTYRKRAGRPPGAVVTVPVTLKLRPDQVEMMKAVAALGLSNPHTKDMSSIVRASIDSFFAQ